MKIALFHSRAVPPKDYGGSERVVHWLSKGLVELGHEVFLFAPEGSAPAPGVRWIPFGPPENDLLELRRRIPQGIDMIHSSVPLTEEQEKSLPAHLVTTIHGNGKSGERFSSGAIFVSENHAKRHGRTAYVYNGIDPAEFHSLEVVRKSKRRGAIFLSKTSWSVKNLRGAAGVARRSGVALQIAGGHRPFVIRAEAFCRPSWKWWGPVGGQRKADLLVSGQVLLFPVLWDEPFGIVVAESLISGMPVLSTPQGSLPELISSGTGRLIPWENVEEWGEAVSDICSGRLPFDPEECRARALERFHYLQMASAYVEYYRKRLSGVF